MGCCNGMTCVGWQFMGSPGVCTSPTPAPTPSSTPQCWPSDNSDCSYTVIDTGSFPDCWSTKEECLKHVQQYCFAPEGSWCVPKQQPPGGDCYKTKDECEASYQQPTPAPTSQQQYCPRECAASTCAQGDPSNGGQQLTNGICIYHCSQYYGDYRYCGGGPTYSSNGGIDCSGCA